MATREDVYNVLNGERAYQEKWNDIEDLNNVGDFICYMQNYLDDARRSNNPGSKRRSLDAIRKVTAIGVACMEKHGAIPRG